MVFEYPPTHPPSYPQTPKTNRLMDGIHAHKDLFNSVCLMLESAGYIIIVSGSTLCVSFLGTSHPPTHPPTHPLIHPSIHPSIHRRTAAHSLSLVLLYPPLRIDLPPNGNLALSGSRRSSHHPAHLPTFPNRTDLPSYGDIKVSRLRRSSRNPNRPLCQSNPRPRPPLHDRPLSSECTQPSERSPRYVSFLPPIHPPTSLSSPPSSSRPALVFGVHTTKSTLV